ncbi:uncharacterized protein BO88DRAFT_427780 [Aspergillus vadensis CBS 113365]|uniref:Uncharacterized protein n=1 Tax=Aspergillus vadensis (strain CBS 113365 / IMI 142717 / IBT 24658) TaxID=1448311 RepID=A0A319BUE4_ASPVC|nr:hypothetical protein BO88DRAFT_427780 [Aspergillus vadensis CBS 113365]PYH66718.1 hypothetical protein BO88DRAFT_427780 [Aspergillus vadensis CBS 113365]
MGQIYTDKLSRRECRAKAARLLGSPGWRVIAYVVDKFSSVLPGTVWLHDPDSFQIAVMIYGTKLSVSTGVVGRRQSGCACRGDISQSRRRPVERDPEWHPTPCHWSLSPMVDPWDATMTPGCCKNKTRINSHMEKAGWLSQSGLDDVEECSSTGFKLMRLGHDRAGVDSVGACIAGQKMAITRPRLAEDPGWLLPNKVSRLDKS